MLTVESRKSIKIPISELVTENRLEVFPEVESEGYFTVKFRGPDLYLTAGRFVGRIPVSPTITIEVTPKLPVSNLARVVEIAEHPLQGIESFPRLYLRTPELTDGILEFLARNLVKALEEIETHGLSKTYVLSATNSSHPRGRINFRQTTLLNYSRGIRHKLYSSRYEHTIDHSHNRLLKYVLWFVAQRLSRTSRRDRELCSSLNRMLLLFEGVSFDRSKKLIESVREDLLSKRIPANRRYYEGALAIALTILSGQGISLVGHGSEVELSSYIIDFETLFESYLRQVLRANMVVELPGIRIRDGNGEAKKRLFDNRKEPTANPDIVIDEPGSIKMIADVKYKDKIDRADINQVITYGCSYRVSNLLLIHQSGVNEASGIQLVGRMDQYSLYRYAYDLANASLEQEEKAFCQAIKNFCV